MHLKPLDFLVIGGYFLGLFLLGVILAGRQTSRDIYYLGDRRVPWFLAGISVVATLLSTVSYLAMPGEMIRHGVGFFTSLLAFAFIVPLVIRVIIPAIMRLPVTSVYDYLERRFGRPARTLGATVFVVMRLIWMGLILYTAARAIVPMTGWPIPVVIYTMGLVTLCYTSMGGMTAVIWSDMAQFVILFGGAILIPLYIWAATGDGPAEWWDVFSKADRASPAMFSWNLSERTTVLGMMLVIFFWNVCTHTSDQVAVQRYLSTPSVAAARLSFLVFSVANILLVSLLAVGGLSLFYFHYRDSGLPLDRFQSVISLRADDVLPEFIARELPAGLSGLMLAALLAAAMSSLSSAINSISAVVLVDLWPAAPSQEAGSRHAVTRPIILSVAAGLVGVGVALTVDRLMRSSDWNLVDLIEKVNHLFVAPMGALFLSGIWLRRAGLGAALLGFFAGVVTSVLVSFSDLLLARGVSFMWIMPAAFAATVVVTYVAAFVFPAASEEQLEALYRHGSRR
jgi:SSS family solute:Na+ symporter